MPDVSQKQHNFMEMVAHDPKAAKRVGVPQSVGSEFVHADQKAGKYAEGGMVGKGLTPAPPEFIARLKAHGLETPQELERALNAVGHTLPQGLAEGGKPTGATGTWADMSPAEGLGVDQPTIEQEMQNQAAVPPLVPQRADWQAPETSGQAPEISGTVPTNWGNTTPPSVLSSAQTSGFQIPNLPPPDYSGAMKATRESGEAQASQGQAIGSVQASQAQQYSDLIKIQTDAEANSRKKIQDAIDIAKSDPRQEWSGAKHVTAGIAAVLGGMGAAAYGGRNIAVEILEKQIDRQVGLNKDFVAHLETKYGDEHQANLAARIAFRENALTEIDAIKNSTQSGVVKANAELAAQNIGISQQKDTKELHLKEIELGINRLRYQREMWPYLIPGYKDSQGQPLTATSTEGAAKINQFKSNYDALKPMLMKLKALAAKGSSATPTDISDAKTTALNAQNLMRQLEGQGVFKEGTAKFDAKMIPDNVRDWIPWNTKGSFNKQLDITMQGLAAQEKGLLGSHVLNYQQTPAASAVPFQSVTKKVRGNG